MSSLLTEINILLVAVLMRMKFMSRVVSDDGGQRYIEVSISKDITQMARHSLIILSCIIAELKMYLSANNTDATKIESCISVSCSFLIFCRSFTKDAWNAIVLPMNLSGDQVKRLHLR